MNGLHYSKAQRVRVAERDRLSVEIRNGWHLYDMMCEWEVTDDPDWSWRFDYAIAEHRIAVEVEGGVFSGGRHTRPTGFLGDVEKYNTATLYGWRLFRVTPSRLISASTMQLLHDAITLKYVKSK